MVSSTARWIWNRAFVPAVTKPLGWLGVFVVRLSRAGVALGAIVAMVVVVAVGVGYILNYAATAGGQNPLVKTLLASIGSAGLMAMALQWRDMLAGMLPKTWEYIFAPVDPSSHPTPPLEPIARASVQTAMVSVSVAMIALGLSLPTEQTEKPQQPAPVSLTLHVDPPSVLVTPPNIDVEPSISLAAPQILVQSPPPPKTPATVNGTVTLRYAKPSFLFTFANAGLRKRKCEVPEDGIEAFEPSNAYTLTDDQLKSLEALAAALKACGQPENGSAHSGPVVKVKVYGYASSAHFAECNSDQEESWQISEKLNARLAKQRRDTVIAQLSAFLGEGENAAVPKYIQVDPGAATELRRYSDRNGAELLTTSAGPDQPQTENTDKGDTELLNRIVTVEIADTGRCEFTGTAIMSRIGDASAPAEEGK
ncbi:hypothetical protein [Dongia sedimenti]|uniref:Uncharacterized protein n=1 Tax=Dongia sedimenti TaxID=3064282 RepID=A0ABU0YSE1_9PROT|nr:hypothetical protein [Rhodospirillaceae bacterium R-7]